MVVVVLVVLVVVLVALVVEHKFNILEVNVISQKPEKEQSYALQLAAVFTLTQVTLVIMAHGRLSMDNYHQEIRGSFTRTSNHTHGLGSNSERLCCTK